MSRLSLALVLLVGIMAGGLGVALLDRQPQKLDAAEVNALVEAYLMDDPTILKRMSDKLAYTQRVAARDAQKVLLEMHHAEIYDASGNVVLGNPAGDVTLVEMFDYNCGYCRGALPDLATLMAEDPGLKVILKEFPILSDGSVEAAKVAVLVNNDDTLDYWAFHQKLFASRGQVGAEAALTAAEAVGGNRVAMMIDMNGKAAGDAIQQSYQLASALDISGTPTYIIGDELIPGAIGIDALRGKIANMRACGSTVCPAPEG
jgi:protein-disulfide isomerase